MAFERNTRLSEEVRKVLSNIVQNELKDPRIPPLTSITHVDVTKDLRYAKVYVSVFADNESKKSCIEGLKSASGFLRKELGNRIKIRYTPELIFELDESIEYSMKINDILREINKNE
ncbi:MAG: rbfA [Caloramator sp.]|jgi:ribosome-binding factor A|uniref:Ribosome-binding factor A n=1 Tax=Caloramator proteoclasticus DSM 10124 TaxID=1121262 RepID=A0A1M4SMM3_9CLOT|nr:MULTISPECIES: 30S ribosome-binding factor RbfA [Caloramator]MBZ4663505.1 rbfA [Caloramator sp.]SHE33402.1 ribosome-binding factor A [Caloramator proteoclasticus DSM 10124]